MLSTIFTFLRSSLVPSKQVLRLRLAPLHAYMGAAFILTLVITTLDFLVIRPDFFIPMWLFLHGFAIFFFYLIWVSIIALFVQLFTKIYSKNMLPYRQSWPYAVSMTLVPTVLLVTLYHINSNFIVIGLIIGLGYVIYPLTKVPQKKQRRASS
ncbi:MULTISPECIES: hypothetical protein [Exiguobacterium]|uniref:hypothetical protein n=1 Tax=Exiguobacterium TaxID=33986 RepID=UPI00047C1D8F|nr:MULTISPECIES: hypothetical protein [Exiguobacterium]